MFLIDPEGVVLARQVGIILLNILKSNVDRLGTCPLVLVLGKQ